MFVTNNEVVVYTDFVSFRANIADNFANISAFFIKHRRATATNNIADNAMAIWDFISFWD